MIVSIEQHVDFIADLFLKMQKEGDQSVAASQAAQDEWVDHVNELSKSDLVKSHSSCNSWYLGANIPGKPRVFMPYVGGVGRYRQECEEIVAAGYKGFVFA
jgi:cyclohexanone monooxygenase